MKYWNKQKRYRSTWTVVKIYKITYSPTWDAMKLWCQLNESKSRFYSAPYAPFIWYFENANDALVFKLTHGYK